MPKDMTSVRHDRLSRIMAFLQSKGKATHEEIYSAGEYRSDRTLQNDLCYLRGVYGADIRYDIHERRYILESAGIFHVNLKITESEITALSAGLGMASHFLPHLKDSVRSLWEKLGKYIPDEILSLGSEVISSTMNAIPVAEIDAEIFRTLIESKRSGKSVNILYSAPGRMPKQWTLSPYDFYFRGNAWYMVSYNHKYENLGIHRISRIISASNSEKEYITPDEGGFDEGYVLSAWHVIPGKEKIPVKVRISEPLAETFREIKWHPTQKIKESDEGGIILTAEVPNLYEFARWVMSGAPHITVIEPDELKEIVTGFAEEVLSQYCLVPHLIQDILNR